MWVVAGAGVLIYQNNDRCEALFENGGLVCSHSETDFLYQVMYMHAGDDGSSLPCSRWCGAGGADAVRAV